ncbi:MAG: hypothetical protein HPY64_05830 [Anaerolineae bacterium]|nr:hypothetical protein [Anaerolineae bacterium]
MLRRVIGGIVIVALAAALTLEISGVAPGAALQVLPFLVLLGAALLLWRAVWPGAAAREQTTLDVPLDGAVRARLDLTFGAGELTLSGDAPPGTLISGAASGPARTHVRRAAEGVSVTLGQPVSLIRQRAAWQLALSPAATWTSIRLRLGASAASLDLTHLPVEKLTLEAGGTTLQATLPAAGDVTLQISGGRTRLRIPAGAAAIIRSEIRLGEVIVDEGHFVPAGSETAWAVAGIAPVSATLSITLKGGLGTVEIAAAPDDSRPA